MSRRFICCVLLLGAAPGCKGKADAGEEKAKPTVAAKTVVVTTQPFTETVGAIGNVVARSGHVAALTPPAGGRVASVLVTTGQSVGVGQVLVELDRAPFQSAVQSTEAALTAAERAFERNQRLVNEGISPRKDLDAAAGDLGKARADAAAAQRQLQLATIRSPISGVVTRLTATIGGPADPVQPLVEIADPSTLDILFNVTATEAARMRPGAKVSLSAGQNASGEPLGIAAVVDISGVIDSVSRSVAVRAQAPTTRRPMRIGETVFGAIAIGTNPSAIVVPIEALVPEGDAFKVFVVDAAGMAHAREVTVGGRTNTTAEITDGLKAGERVVTYGAYGLEDSVKVVPMDAKAPEKPDSAAKPDSTKKP